MKILNYFQTATTELRRVTWPTRKQAVRITTIVLIFTLTSALALGVLDFLFSSAYTSLFNLTKP